MYVFFLFLKNNKTAKQFNFQVYRLARPKFQ